MQPLRIYLIGAGVAAHAHAATIALLPDEEHVELAVADPSSAALDAFLHVYPQARVFTSAQEMLAEPANERDIVIVAAPPFVHCDLSCAALRSGRHVLCEKPFAMNMQEALEMLRVAREMGRMLGCCSSRSLGSPLGQEIHAALDKGILGDLYHLRFLDCGERYRPGIEQQPESRWFVQQSRSGGGVLMNLGVYDMSFINELLKPERVDVLAAWIANPTFAVSFEDGTVPDVEQHAGATMRYHLPGGSSIVVTYERASCKHGQPITSMELVGINGALRWDWFMWVSPASLTYTTEKDGRIISQEQQFERKGVVETMHKPLYYFHQYLLHKPSPAIVNERAVFNFACLQALYECARTQTVQSIDLREFLM